MKYRLSAFILSLLLSSHAFASHMVDMEGRNMQQMMLQMQKMQQCLMQVNAAEIHQYEVEISKFESKLRSLCQQGKREQAQTEALEFAKKIANSEAIKTIQACTKDMRANAFMPATPDFENLDGQHICDQFNQTQPQP